MDPISSYPSIPSTSTASDNGASTKAGIAERVKDTVKEKFDDVSHKVSDAATSVKDRASAATQSSRQMVQDNPLRTLGITLGAGIVIGLIMSRALR